MLLARSRGRTGRPGVSDPAADQGEVLDGGKAVQGGGRAHGGGDDLLLDDVFRGPGDDPLARRAGHLDGIRSVLVGVAADVSSATGAPVRLTAEGTRLAD